MFDLTNPIYSDADKAREHLEAIHWPDGPICPHCGNCDQKRITKLQGKSTRPGVFKCKECRKPFSVTVGTVFERSKIPLNKWVLATHLMAASKKGISAHQLHRMLGVTYKTAWFMAHRIREAMAPSTLLAARQNAEYPSVNLWRAASPAARTCF
jgi:transposase-like protein